MHHPYLDGGLFFSKPTESALHALRAVAAEVVRYGTLDYVGAAYDSVLYSPYLPKQQYWAAFEPKFPEWGSPSDQQWLRLEHERRVWEVMFNRVLTH